jgi:ribosomal protein S18 acetylase RimI-like enzyme
VSAVLDAERASQLNELELWREMVRWSRGEIVEAQGMLVLSGPSAYLRVATRSDPAVDAASVVRRAIEVFGGDPLGFIVLARLPDEQDVQTAALAEGFTAGWTELPMLILSPPAPGTTPEGIDVRRVTDAAAVLDYGRVVAEANVDPGERERAPLLFHGETIVAPHIAAYVAYREEQPVSCAMTLVSHGIAGVFYVATVESARRRGLGDLLTRLAARTGFEMGAKAAWLGASEMGAGLYRRIGFHDLGSTLVELESPAGG